MPSSPRVSSLTRFPNCACSPAKACDTGAKYSRSSVFADKDTTVLLLDDRTAEGNDLQLQSIAHGVIMLQSLGRDFGIKRRRLEIRKMRGAKFREGFHDYTIETGGVEVYPRLVAAEHRPPVELTAARSGVKELDDLFSGGIDFGTSTLMIGPAGTGKSTVAIQYAYAAALRANTPRCTPSTRPCKPCSGDWKRWVLIFQNRSVKGG